MNFSGILAATAGFCVAAFMLYFPYVWCELRREREDAYGLRWYMGRGAWWDTILALVITLVPLTFVSLNWPPAWGTGGP